MMKSKAKSLVISCLAVLIGGLLMMSFGTQYLRKLSPMFNFVFPPEDIYQCLSEIPFSTSSAGKLYECSFTPKYPGYHSIELIAAKPLKVMEPYEAAFLVDIAIKDEEGTVLVEEKATPPYSPFWGTNDSGIKLLNFKASENVPLDKPLTACIRVKTMDGAFEEKYGPLTLRIMKISDE